MQFFILSPTFFILHLCVGIAILLFIYNKKSFNLIHYTAYAFFIFACVGYLCQTLHYLYNAQFFNFLPLMLIDGALTSLFILLFDFKIQQLQHHITPQTPNHFVGYFATIYSEKARTDEIATAYVRDQFGKEHYIPVVAESGEIAQYTPVIILRPEKNHYVVRNIQSLVE